MKQTTLNSDGSPVLRWEEAGEAESELQRTRRRYQQRRCLACGAPDRWRTSNFCKDCYDAGWRYCFACEGVRPLSDFWNQGECKSCQLNRQCPRRTATTAVERSRAAAAAAVAARREKVKAQMRVIHSLIDRGWTHAEVARYLSAQTGKHISADAIGQRIRHHAKNKALHDDS